MLDAREYAALMIQLLFRSKRFRRKMRLSKCDLRALEKRNQAARDIQRFYRSYKDIQMWKLARYHQHPFLMKVKINELRLKKDTAGLESQKFIVVISSIKIEDEDPEASEDQRLNSGSCATCDYTAPTEGCSFDTNVYVGGLTSHSYIAVTVLREDGARIEYIGQGYIKLADYSNELFLKNRNVPISISLGKAKVEIRKDGGCFAKIGQELFIPGKVLVTLSMTRSAFNMAGHITKLTETLVSSNFKRRYVVLCDGVLSYFGSPYSLFDVKQFMRCEDVISLTEEEGRNGDWIVEIKTQGIMNEQGFRNRGDVWTLKWGLEE
jgi:hypothetical protein